MSEDTITTLPGPSNTGRRLRSNLPRGGSSPDPLTGVIRDGARKLFEQAIEAELAAAMTRPGSTTVRGGTTSFEASIEAAMIPTLKGSAATPAMTGPSSRTCM